MAVEKYEHYLEAIEEPQLISLTDQLVAIRFESLKIAATYKAIKMLLDESIITPNTTIVDSSSGTLAYALALSCHRLSLSSLEY